MQLLGEKETVPPPPAEPQKDQWVEDLCFRMKNGEEDAFRFFFETFADRVFRFCLSLTRGNEHLSRDILQIVMIKCARGIPVFGTERKLWAWLAQVARNSFIDHLRREKCGSFDGQLQIAASDGKSPAEEDNELIEALEASLLELPAEEQLLIDAIYNQKLPHKKVAELSNTTPKAVESSLARLRRKLRENILNKLKTYALI